MDGHGKTAGQAAERYPTRPRSVRFQAGCGAPGWTGSGVGLPPARPDPALRARGALGVLRRSRRGNAGALHLGGRRLAGSPRALRLALGGSMLEQRVDLAAEDEDEPADVEPGHQHDDPADRAVGLVVAAEVLRVVR